MRYDWIQAFWMNEMNEEKTNNNKANYTVEKCSQLFKWICPIEEIQCSKTIMSQSIIAIDITRIQFSFLCKMLCLKLDSTHALNHCHIALQNVQRLTWSVCLWSIIAKSYKKKNTFFFHSLIKSTTHNLYYNRSVKLLAF